MALSYVENKLVFWAQTATKANIKYAELKHHQQLKIEGIVDPSHQKKLLLNINTLMNTSPGRIILR